MELENPADLLSKVDEHIDLFEPGTMATTLCATLEPDPNELLISTARHPPPAVATADGDVDLLELRHDLLLGVDATRTRNTTSVSLEPGSTICFYTDGLVERRDASLDTGFDRISWSQRPTASRLRAPPVSGSTRHVPRCSLV